MNDAFSALAARLRSARAEQAIAGAASGVRQWSDAMASAAPALPRSDAMPAEADLQALLDPLAESGLAAAQIVTRPDAPARAATAPPRRPVGAATSGLERTSAKGPKAASSATPAARREPGASPATISAWLARLEHLRPAPADAATQRLETPTPEPHAANVVRLPPRTLLGAAFTRVETPGLVAKTIADWQAAYVVKQAIQKARAELLVGQAMQRVWAGAASDAVVRTSVQAVAAVVEPLRDVFSPPGAPQRSAAGQRVAKAPARSHAGARLADMARDAIDSALASADALGVPAPAAESQVAEPAPPLSGTPLTAIDERLARIEKRLGTPLPERDATQWLDDDDVLAERIHALLRRQAQRHGISTP